MSNYYKQLRDKHEHLQKRTWELFKEGMAHESMLNETVVNAWKQFSRIAESENLDEAKEFASKGKILMEQRLEKYRKCRAKCINDRQ